MVAIPLAGGCLEKISTGARDSFRKKLSRLQRHLSLVRLTLRQMSRNLRTAARVSRYGDDPISDRLVVHQGMEARAVDTALKLNVLAACVAFAFIGAILIRAF